MSLITRYRGDTYEIQFTVTHKGAAKDITDHDFVLAVQDHANPQSEDDPLFTIAGVLTDPTNGVVTFTPTTTQVNRLGRYWYDVEMTDPGGEVTTLEKGPLRFSHDLTTTYQQTYEFSGYELGTACIWPDVTPMFGRNYSKWPDEMSDIDSPVVSIRERDGVRVAAFEGLAWVQGQEMGNVNPQSMAYRHASAAEVIVRVYIKNVYWESVIWGCGGYAFDGLGLRADGTYDWLWYRYHWGADGADEVYDEDVIGTGAPEGWYCSRLRWEAEDHALKQKAWSGALADEPDAWDNEDDYPDSVDSMRMWPFTGPQVMAADYIAELDTMIVVVEA